MWKRVAGVIGGLLVLLIVWASPQDGQKIAEGGAKWAAFGGLVAALAGLPGLIGSIVRSWRGRSSVHQSAPRHNPFNPSLAVGKTEAIAFRLLLLAWVVGGGALIYAGYADFRANMEQEPVERLFVPIRECVNNVLAVPACGQNTKLIGPCERALNQCNEWSAEARQFAAAVNRRDHWAEIVGGIEWIGMALLIGASLLFYVGRWALTGRLRSIWLAAALKKQP